MKEKCMDTKTPDGAIQLARDMTAAEYRIARTLAIRKAYADAAKQQDEADLKKVTAR